MNFKNDNNREIYNNLTKDQHKIAWTFQEEIIVIFRIFMKNGRGKNFSRLGLEPGSATYYKEALLTKSSGQVD